MAKIMHVQTVLIAEDIEALKIKTGESHTKDALSKAVYHYLGCEMPDKKVLENTGKNQVTVASGAKIFHVQTVLPVEDIEALKIKAGESSTKDALAKAVQHYLDCECVSGEKEKEMEERRKKVLDKKMQQQ